MQLPLTWSQIEESVGASRVRLYVEHCGNDQAKAVELYRWNARLAAAFWLDLGHMEVALRNALDARMIARYQACEPGTDWLDVMSRQVVQPADGCAADGGVCSMVIVEVQPSRQLRSPFAL